MARFDLLPVELLRIIGHSVAGEAIVGVRNKRNLKVPRAPRAIGYGNGDLAALARTNRRFNQVFEPLLYQWDAQQIDGGSAVIWALDNMSMGTLERSLASGFDFNSDLATWWDGMDDEICDFAIFHAVQEGREPMLKWLLEHGAKPDLCEPLEIANLPLPVSYEQRSALSMAMDPPGNEEAALILLDYGARVLLAEEWDVGQDLSITSALHEAVRNDFTRVVERLLRDGTIPVNHRDSDNMSALELAAREISPNSAMIELLLRYGADPIRDDETRSPTAVCLAFAVGNPDNIAPLLRHITKDPSNKDFFSHNLLWILLNMVTDRPMSMAFGSDAGPSQYKSIVSKLVEFGADFNNPPPPYAPQHEHEPFIALAYESFNGYIFTALLELGVNPFVKIDGNRNLFDAKWYDYLRGETEGMEHHLAALLNFGARIDVKDPRTQRTAFELALRAAENSDCPNPQPLQFLLEHVVPSTLTCKYIYETLDSQIEDLEGHIKSSILIMQHGWISEKARSFVFDWLVSYNTFSSVREGLHIKNEDHWLNQKAARFFPRFLTRQQLDLLWEKSRASYAATDQSRRNHNLYYVLERWYSMPWWLINAERGDVEAMKLLAEWEHPRTDPDWLFGDDSERFIMAGNDGGHTPLMRAIATGSKDVAIWLLEANNGAVRGSFNCHHFRESVSDDPEDDSEDEVEGFECDLCPYGQRTAYEIAVHRGEVELLEIMWDLELDEVKWEEYIAMPRVFSYSNVMVEWMQLKLGTKRWMKLEMSGQDAWLRNEISKKLAKLRIEIVEIREAWRAQAKAFESRGMGIVEAS